MTTRPPRQAKPGSRITPAADARVPRLTANPPSVKYPTSTRVAASPASRSASEVARHDVVADGGRQCATRRPRIGPMTLEDLANERPLAPRAASPAPRGVARGALPTPAAHRGPRAPAQ